MSTWWAVVAFPFLCLAPDLLSIPIAGNPSPLSDRTSLWISLLALALIGAVPQSRWRRGLIVFLVVIQTVWLAAVAYFGEVPYPEQVMLGLRDSGDLLRSAIGNLRVLAPSLAAMALYGAALLVFDRRFLGCAHRFRVVLPVAVLASAAIVIRPLLLANPLVAASDRGDQSYFGLLSTLGTALRIGLSRVLPPADIAPGRATVSRAEPPPPDETTTIAIIMGESISPVRMALYGGTGTGPNSPLLARAARRDDPFHLFAKIGPSSGSATLASVPSFIRLSYMPVAEARPAVDLFRLAKDAGYDVRLFSAQRRWLVQASGALGSVDQVEDADAWPERYAAVRDTLLLEHLRRLDPARGPKRLVFLHQRANHSGYAENCPPDRPLPPVPAGVDARLGQYDQGLACYENYLDALLAFFRGQTGAVHVFVTSDHGELTGEDGLWGHPLPHPGVVMVPMMLYTNRPDSEVARRFRALTMPSGYEFGRLVALALGFEVTDTAYRPDVFHFAHALPFGLGGSFVGYKSDGPALRTRQYAKDGTLVADRQTVLPAAIFEHGR